MSASAVGPVTRRACLNRRRHLRALASKGRPPLGVTGGGEMPRLRIPRGCPPFDRPSAASGVSGRRAFKIAPDSAFALRSSEPVLSPESQKIARRFRSRPRSKNLEVLFFPCFPLQPLEIPQNRQRNPWKIQAFSWRLQNIPCRFQDIPWRFLRKAWRRPAVAGAGTMFEAVGSARGPVGAEGKGVRRAKT